MITLTIRVPSELQHHLQLMLIPLTNPRKPEQDLGKRKIFFILIKKNGFSYTKDKNPSFNLFSMSDLVVLPLKHTLGCKLYIREVGNDKDCILLRLGVILLVFTHYPFIGHIEYKCSCLKMFSLIRFSKFLDCLAERQRLTWTTDTW